MSRSPKQIAQAKAYGGTAGLFLEPRDAGMPTDSWWCGKDRQEFSETARAQVGRLKQSRFGRLLLPMRFEE